MKSSLYSIPIIAGFIISTLLPVYSQTTDEIHSYLQKIDQGQSAEVKKALPDLVTKYQNTPGIMYLQGRLASDGIEAVKFYQSVVDNFPKSEWADDALYRIYQYYYALGLYRTADLKMAQLKKEYPNSPHVTGKELVTSPKQEESPVKLPSAEPVQTDSQQITKTPAPPVQQSYTLQTGAFSTMANAQKQKTFFEDSGYTAEITNKIRGGKSLYLVWVGNYKTPDEARAVSKEIKSKYKIDSFFLERY
ncbi:MAG TPA: SPOR domain-containing protein [Bacteroidota bacterium]|nr:SPOR domain-containing protein [Bacteroidota bacterium]